MLRMTRRSDRPSSAAEVLKKTAEMRFSIRNSRNPEDHPGKATSQKTVKSPGSARAGCSQEGYGS